MSAQFSNLSRMILLREGSGRMFYKGLLSLLVAVPLAISAVSVAHAATAPDLGVAAGYSVFGNAGVTETAGQTSHLWGDVGDNGFGHDFLIPSQVDGTIDDQANVPVANAIASAYGDLADVSQGATTPLDLDGGGTVGPGLYDVAAGALNGTLTLDGPGVYIFRSTSSISVSGGGTMNLINGATACDVFWQIPTSMTIASAADMAGTIITNTGLISFVSGASLEGRAWASTQVTLDNNQITEPACAAEEEEEEAVDGRSSRRPIISVTKIPNPLALPGPGNVTYTYEVSNHRGYAMNNVTLVDNKCTDMNYISGDSNNDSLLQPNEIWIYRCTTWLAEDTNNEARATGYANGYPAADIAYATVNVGNVLPPPLIHVIKKPSVFLLPFGGGKVTYTYTVSNPGVVALHYLQVTDDKCSNVNYISGDEDEDNELDTDETWIYNCKAVLDLTTTNTATASGNANNQTATDVSFSTVVVAARPVVVPTPAVELHPSAPVPTQEVPLLPNTGIGSDAESISWAIVAIGLVSVTSLLFVSYTAKKFLLLHK